MKSLDLERTRPLVTGLFRIVVGMLFACHGAATLFGVFGGPQGGGAGPAVFGWPDWWAAAIELVGGLFVVAGLGTRIAALICSGSMAFAYFDVHQRNALLPIQNHGEPAAMFCWAFLLIAVLGAGSFSLDGLLFGSPGPRVPSQGAEPVGPEPVSAGLEPEGAAAAVAGL